MQLQPKGLPESTPGPSGEEAQSLGYECPISRRSALSGWRTVFAGGPSGRDDGSVDPMTQGSRAYGSAHPGLESGGPMGRGPCTRAYASLRRHRSNRRLEELNANQIATQIAARVQPGVKRRRSAGPASRLCPSRSFRAERAEPNGLVRLDFESDGLMNRTCCFLRKSLWQLSLRIIPTTRRPGFQRLVE